MSSPLPARSAHDAHLRDVIARLEEGDQRAWLQASHPKIAAKLMESAFEICDGSPSPISGGVTTPPHPLERPWIAYPRAWTCRPPRPKHTVDPFPVRTDYLTCTAKIPAGAWNASDSLRTILQAAVGSAWGEYQEQQHGFLGWERSAKFERGGVRVAWGGQDGTVMVTIPGQGCELVPDWGRLVVALSQGLGARITRWDGACDDYSGVYDVDHAVSEYKAGRFSLKRRPPSCACAGDWHGAQVHGRTFYVGKRKSGKTARVYEKGKQMKDHRSSWVRWEIEYHRVDRDIPWSACLDPRPYIAGCYPAFDWVAGDGPPKAIPTGRSRAQISMDHLVYHLRRCYGKVVDTMAAVGATAQEVFDRIRLAGVPARLELDEQLRSGVADPARLPRAPGWLWGLGVGWELAPGGAWTPDSSSSYWSEWDDRPDAQAELPELAP